MVASTCSYGNYDTRIIVYEGMSCPALTCIGEFQRRDEPLRHFPLPMPAWHHGINCALTLSRALSRSFS
jgi:hypothetical protein